MFECAVEKLLPGEAAEGLVIHTAGAWWDLSVTVFRHRLILSMRMRTTA